MKRYSKNDIDKLANILKKDGVICVPTDTVYGLCSRINKESFDKLVMIKNRPINKNFPIMCSSIEQIKSISYIDDISLKIIEEFMPGPITIVLKKKDNYYDDIINNDTIAIRLASDELKELINKVGSPLFMTSANKSGKMVCNSLDEIETNLDLIDGILEGNPLYGEASTIVKVDENNIIILRDGPIKYDMIIDKIKRH